MRAHSMAETTVPAPELPAHVAHDELSLRRKIIIMASVVGTQVVQVCDVLGFSRWTECAKREYLDADTDDCVRWRRHRWLSYSFKTWGVLACRDCLDRSILSVSLYPLASICCTAHMRAQPHTGRVYPPWRAAWCHLRAPQPSLRGCRAVDRLHHRQWLCAYVHRTLCIACLLGHWRRHHGTQRCRATLYHFPTRSPAQHRAWPVRRGGTYWGGGRRSPLWTAPAVYGMEVDVLFPVG